jgi:hypothetical protein
MIVVYPYKTLFRKIIGGVFTKLFTRNTLFSGGWYYVTIVDACFFSHALPWVHTHGYVLTPLLGVLHNVDLLKNKKRVC